MKTMTRKQTYFELHEPDPTFGGRPFEFVLLDNGLFEDRLELASAEQLERIAAALERHRRDGGDHRSVCPDHGYQHFGASASGFKCPVCDPRQQAPEQDASTPFDAPVDVVGLSA